MNLVIIFFMFVFNRFYQHEYNHHKMRTKIRLFFETDNLFNAYLHQPLLNR